MEEKSYHISISPIAAEQVINQLKKRGTPNAYVRLGVQGAGCSGYKYVIKFEDNSLKEKDQLFLSNGITIIVDSKSLVFLDGCTLDWEQTLFKQGFKFNNPNQTSSCGCGKSVTF